MKRIKQERIKEPAESLPNRQKEFVLGSGLVQYRERSGENLRTGFMQVDRGELVAHSSLENRRRIRTVGAHRWAPSNSQRKRPIRMVYKRTFCEFETPKFDIVNLALVARNWRLVGLANQSGLSVKHSLLGEKSSMTCRSSGIQIKFQIWISNARPRKCSRTASIR